MQQVKLAAFFFFPHIADMKRLILAGLVCGWLAGLAGVANAAPLEWALKASSDAADAQGKFCAVEQRLQNGPHVTIARNLIGQYSLIAVVGDNDFRKNTRLTAKIEIGKTFARQITSSARDEKTLVLPLGWDSQFVAALNNGGDHLPVHVTANQKEYHYFLDGMRGAMGQLASCANSLLERNPTSVGLPLPVRSIVDQAGLADMRLVQFQDAKAGTKPASPRQSWTWVYDNIFGGVDIVPIKDGTTLDDQILSYLDRLEKLCRGQFTSSFSPPQKIKNNRQLADAEADCQNSDISSFSSLIFLQNTQSIYIFYTETDQSSKPNANAQKALLINSIRKL